MRCFRLIVVLAAAGCTAGSVPIVPAQTPRPVVDVASSVPSPGLGSTSTLREGLGEDHDADRLTDDGERRLGTDPLDPDTDGDGYADGDEVDLRSDPLDDLSWIYQGGWPYCGTSADDDVLPSRIHLGAPLPRMVLPDQFGQVVTIQDFACDELPVVLQLISLDCPRCEDVSAVLAGAPLPPGMSSAWHGVRDDIDAGLVRFITLVTGAGPVPWEDAALWDQAFPHGQIPVLADGGALAGSVDAQPGGQEDGAPSNVSEPSFLLLGPDLTVKDRRASPLAWRLSGWQ